MTTNLRIGFKERQIECLHDTIDVVAPPAKRAYSKEVQEKPVRDVPPMLVPPLDTTGPSSMSVVEKEVGPTSSGAPDGAISIEEVLDQKDTLSSVHPPSWDKMMEMLKRVPCFTNVELSSTRCQISSLSLSGYR